jgi:hypothetical protein
VQNWRVIESLSSGLFVHKLLLSERENMHRLLITLPLIVFTAFQVGCVVEPLNFHRVNLNDREDGFDPQITRFSGWVPFANEPLEVQAYDFRRDSWKTIARTRSGGWGVSTGFAPFQAETGSDKFYYWNAGEVQIPERYWEWLDLSDSMCQVRVVMSNTGQVLPSYDERPNLFANPIDEWIEKGNRNFSDRIILRTRDSNIPQDR